LELGIWSLEFGAWSLELGIWNLDTAYNSESILSFFFFSRKVNETRQIL